MTVSEPAAPLTAPRGLAALTAAQLAARYTEGSASPVEAAEAVLERIAATDPAVNAFCLIDRETTLDQARAAEQRLSRGEGRGPLDGVPVSVKDLLLTRGWPTLRGSHSIDPGSPSEWTQDAPSVARLREAGAVLVGKTTTPEFGWKGVTDAPRTGITRNPWNPERTAGGSSGGAAAAVAVGAGPLALGTDGGGSVRIPAAFCGVFGMKATYGRVPLHPASPFGTLAHVGPLARTAEDAALLLDVITGPDPRDWSALPPPAESYSAALTRDEDGLRGLRVAYSPSFGGMVEVDPGVAAAVRSAVELMVRLGARVEEIDPPALDGPAADPVDAFHTLWFSGAARLVEGLTAQQFARLDPALREICAQGAGITALEYLAAMDTRMALGTAMGTFHQTWDLLVTPALPIPAFEAGVEYPAPLPTGAKHNRWTGWTPFTYPFNLTQQPAAVLPCGRVDGLPVALQLAAARHADPLILRAAHALERAGLSVTST